MAPDAGGTVGVGAGTGAGFSDGAGVDAFFGSAVDGGWNEVTLVVFAADGLLDGVVG